LYALGIPLVSLFVMFRRKHKLHTDNATVSRFGFLYLGYAKHAWYWEAVVMLRKVSMVMIDVVLGPKGVAVQALVALMLLVLMLAATSKMIPFEARHIWRLEMLSLTTSYLSLWLGSFFWSSVNDEATEIVLSFLVVAINVLFLVYLIVVLVGDTCRDYNIVETASTLKRKVSHGSSTFFQNRRSHSNKSKSQSTAAANSTNSNHARRSTIPDHEIHWPASSEMKTTGNPLDQNDLETGVELTNMSKDSKMMKKKKDAAPAKMHRNPHWNKLRLSVKTANAFKVSSGQKIRTKRLSKVMKSKRASAEDKQNK